MTHPLQERITIIRVRKLNKARATIQAIPVELRTSEQSKRVVIYTALANSMYRKAGS